MDMEKVDEKLYDRRRVQYLGFLDLEHFEEFRTQSADGLLRFGDVFAQSIGSALALASVEDALKIMRYWNQLCQDHALMQRMYIAKQKAMEAESEHD